MAEAPEPPALAHIEKTLADSYRKEIDQEENIWRSLPFFAATLALQLTALFQVIERLPSGRSWAVIPARILVVGAFACSLGALALLTASIWKAKFRYIAKDDALLDYAIGLIKDERSPENQAQEEPMVALHMLKENLAAQYATATDNNRKINKWREGRRSDAGLLTILSVISTLLLVAMTFATYVPIQTAQGTPDGPQTPSARSSGATQPGPKEALPTHSAPTHAGSH